MSESERGNEALESSRKSLGFGISADPSSKSNGSLEMKALREVVEQMRSDVSKSDKKIRSIPSNIDCWNSCGTLLESLDKCRRLSPSIIRCKHDLSTMLEVAGVLSIGFPKQIRRFLHCFSTALVEIRPSPSIFRLHSFSR
ncbi:unnamed protein product [Allacma fusca]|uniref:Uncharacterized protein n=1 Tax=Allacma fusca TaxID=39272 RepID=A0A8J2KJB8_9HEXA|nr:unnamed protein product [Allacma fusca]